MYVYIYLNFSDPSSSKHPTDHTASPAHSQQPTSYSNYNPNDYASSPPAVNDVPGSNSYYYAQPTQAQYAPERSYIPDAQHDNSYYSPPAGPPPINTNTNTGYVPPAPTSPVRGPRAQNVSNSDAPPIYDVGISGAQGSWGKPSY